MRGDVRPLLSLGGQLYRRGEPPPVCAVPVAGDGRHPGGGRPGGCAAALGRPEHGGGRHDLDRCLPGCGCVPGLERRRALRHPGGLSLLTKLLLHVHTLDLLVTYLSPKLLPLLSL